MKKVLVIALVVMTILMVLLGLNAFELKQEVKRLELSNTLLNDELVKKEESEVSLEVLACELINKNPKTAVDIETMFLIFPNIDDVKFDEVCKDYGSAFNYEKALAWTFENIEIGNTKDMLNLFRVGKNLNDGLSEGYCENMKNLYRSDRAEFIRAISLSPMNMESIFSGMAVSLFENERWIEEKDALAKMINDDELAPSEKEAVKEFIEVLDWYIKNGV